MKRLAIAMALIGVLAFPAAASAHPSENRAEQGFGGGPHCHFILAGTRAYPSHTAHMAQLEHSPVGTVFAATTCD